MFVIGHRGCRGILPENTLDGFIEAIRLGVDAIELDIVVSLDEEIVVSHEAFMSRVTCTFPDGSTIKEVDDQKINLYHMPYEEIKAFDCGLKHHFKFPNQIKIPAYKPLLAEVIIACETYCKQHKIRPITYLIEIKSKPELYGLFYPNPQEYVAILLKEVLPFQLKSRLVLKSFDVEILNEIKLRDSKKRISLLINSEESIDEKLKQLNFKPEIIGPYFKLLNESMVAQYKSEGFYIYPWTINELTDMKAVKKMGVDGIITDYPDRLINLLSSGK
ncbi:glycerophosphodiester phosphodiesterase family protein [Pseudofulvibacter geojedonensis]|uniref:Glycerophosphodiester phosphodiesterase family protein n=1 Tax=Pseudofulvibacter geojedonensis TaxID=1123758 RepID=A0ABW3I0M2_9FLAO